MTVRLPRRRLPRDLTATVVAVLASLPDEELPELDSTPRRRAGSDSGQWSLHAARTTETGVAVVAAGRAGREPEVIVKVAVAAPTGAQLRRHVAAVRTLSGDTRAGPWLRFVPKILSAGDIEDRFYVVERAIPGVPAATLMASRSSRAELCEAALSTITTLHRLTARSLVVDQATLDRWVSIPVAVLRRVGRLSRWLDRVQDELCTFLTGRTVEVSWVHGDYWPGNVLADGASRSLTGIVDWEFSADDELPAHDGFHFVLFTRLIADRSNLGPLVRDLLRGRPSTAPLRGQLERFVPSGDPQWFRNALLLYWLRHLAAHLGQPATGTNQWVWVRRNVTPVLRAC